VGATERRSANRRAGKLIDGAGPDTNGEGLIDLCDQLIEIAEEISEDFQESRDNLADSQGLLDSWEENTGWQSEGWESAVSELQSVRGDIDGESEDFTPASALEDIQTAWSEGATQA
jgi:hypothetical protein